MDIIHIPEHSQPTSHEKNLGAEYEQITINPTRDRITWKGKENVHW